MTLVNDADAVYLGNTAVDAVYAGTNLVWSKMDPDTKAYLTATGLDSDFAPILDDLVVGLKDHGLWSKMSVAYAFIGGTADLHKWNLKDPRDNVNAYRLTFVGGTHSEAFGYRPNLQGGQGAVANGGYADTHFTPLGNLDVNSTHLAYYSLADLTPISRCEMGCYNWAGSGARFHIIARYTPSEFYYGQCENGASNATVPASSGLFVGTRTAINAQDAYRNGVHIGGNQLGSNSGLPPTTVWVGGINTFVDRTDLPCGFASVGSGLTAQNNADLYTVVQTFQTALGRQV